MGRTLKLWNAAALIVFTTLLAQAAAAESSKPQQKVQLGQADQSLRNEIQHAIDRGLGWLTANQNSNGWWQTADHPAVTGLALMAYNGDPMDRYRGKDLAQLKRAYSFILKQVKPDGSICVTNLPAYNT